jgi:hypothetical protein
MLVALPVGTDPYYPLYEDYLKLQGSLSSPKPTTLFSLLSLMIIVRELESR